MPKTPAAINYGVYVGRAINQNNYRGGEPSRIPTIKIRLCTRNIATAHPHHFFVSVSDPKRARKHALMFEEVSKFKLRRCVAKCGFSGV